MYAIDCYILCQIVFIIILYVESILHFANYIFIDIVNVLNACTHIIYAIHSFILSESNGIYYNIIR